MRSLLRIVLAVVCLFAMVSCAPVDEGGDGLGEATGALTVPVLRSCSEANIRANAPPDASRMLDRAYNWIHRGIPYCQCVRSDSAPYRSDCSGFVSMVWGLGGPGGTTYSFAGGPWDDHRSVRLSSRAQLRVGDALNYPGNPGAHTGHIVLFGGWLNSAHTRFCSLEESHTGTPARVIERAVDSVYLPIRLASRRVGPLCTARCEGGVFIDGDCDRHNCHANGGRCVADGHGARCVDPGCPAWGADTVCLNPHTTASCLNGHRRSTTACTGANPRCSAQGTGVRCESPECPASGSHRVCLPSGQIAQCADGRLGTGSACPTGTFCSETTPGAALCVARVCVAGTTTVPTAHQGCLEGAVLRCDDRGAATTTMCPAGLSCSNVDGHTCVAVACPAASGRQAICVGASERVVCDGGVVIERQRCPGACSTADGTPATCILPPPPPPAGSDGGASADAGGVPSGDAGASDGGAIDDASVPDDAEPTDDTTDETTEEGAIPGDETTDPAGGGETATQAPGGCSTGRRGGNGALPLMLLGAVVWRRRRRG